MSPQEMLLSLVPGALKLAVEAIAAILAGDPAKAARKAEEAARRQAVRMAADAALRARVRK